MSREPELQINEDLDFQRRSWRMQRYGWIGMVLIVLAGLVGLFGNGPLSRVTRWSPGRQVQVDYDRIVRRGAPSDVVVTLDPAPENDVIELRIAQALVEALDFATLRPPPVDTAVTDEAAVLRYAHLGSAAKLELHLRFASEQLGRNVGWLEVAEGERVPIQQWCLP